MNLLLFSFLVCLLVTKCYATESPETESYTNSSDQNIEVITGYNKTVSDLMSEQTEAIRKIISAAHNPEYDPKAEGDKNNQKLQEVSIEQLKEKCEQHFKISGNKHNDKFEELGEGGVVKLVLPLAQPTKPQFLHPVLNTETLYPGNHKTEGNPSLQQNQNSLAQDQHFSQTETHTLTDQQGQLYLTKLAPPAVSQQPLYFQNPNKPFHLAPFIGPQTHHPAEHHTIYDKHNVQTSTTTQFKTAGQSDSKIQNFDYVHVEPVWLQNRNEQTSTTTKLKIAEQNNLQSDSVKTQNFDYVQLEPVWLQKTVLSDGRIFYYWFRKVSQSPLETKAYSAVNEKSQRLGLLQPQLKFVLPVLPANSEVVNRDQWYFEPQGRYSKTARSNFGALPSTLHMIRALKVPHSGEKEKGEEARAKIDDVSVE